MVSTRRTWLSLSLMVLLFLHSSAVAGPITTNRLLWFKADAISGLGDNDPVPSWVDSHGGNNAASGIGLRPTYQSDIGSLLNGLPVVRFDGVDDQLTTSSVAPGSDEATVLVVARVAATTSFGEFVTYGINSAGSWNLRQESSTGRLSFINGATNSGAGATAAFAPAGTTATLVGQGFKILEGTVTAANVWQIWENGDSKHTNTVAFTQAASNTVVLGNRGDAVTSLNGDIAEVIVYSRALTSAERVIEENYLGAKWDRTLSVDRYAGDTPGKGHYDFSVFGIGQHTDASIVTTGTMDGLTIGQDDPLGSDEWVLAGHTNGPNATTTSDMPNAQRWERSWFVDTTNVSTADLSFDWNDAGVLAPFSPLFTGLYYRQLNSGFFSLVAVGTVDVGNQRVDFNGVNLPVADGYFTLGEIPVPEPSTFALLSVGLIGVVIRNRRRRTALGRM